MNGFMKKWLEKYYVILGVLLMAVCVAALVLDAARIAAARMWFGAAFTGALALLLLPPACLCLGWLWRMVSGLVFLVLAWLPRPGYAACLRVMLKEKSRQLRMLETENASLRRNAAKDLHMRFLEAENASLRRNAQELNESMLKMQNDIREERLTRNLKRMAWDERDEMQRNRDAHIAAGLRRKLADYRELVAELNGRIAEQGLALNEISAAYRKLEETCRRLEKEALAARLNRPGRGERRLPKLELPPAPEMLAAGA